MRLFNIQWLGSRLSFGLSLICCIVSLQAPAQTAEMGEGKVGTFSGDIVAKHPAWFKESFLDFGDDIAEAADKGKRLVLYFYQMGCPYCNQLWAHNMAVDGIEQEFRSKFDVVAINMWGDQEVITVAGKSFTEKQLARALDVDFTPTLQFYDEKKQQVLRLNGYLPPKRFKQALQYASGKHDLGQTFSEFTASQVPLNGVLTRTEPFIMETYKGLINRKQKPASKPLAVLFEQPNCPGCEQFHDVTLKHEDTRQLLSAMDVVQLNALNDGPLIKPNGEISSAKQWAQDLKINYYPSIVFFDESGEQVMLMDAYFRNFHTQSILAYVLEKGYETEPSFQRYISARADHFVEQGIDVDIWAE